MNPLDLARTVSVGLLREYEMWKDRRLARQVRARLAAQRTEKARARAAWESRYPKAI